MNHRTQRAQHYGQRTCNGNFEPLREVQPEATREIKEHHTINREVKEVIEDRERKNLQDRNKRQPRQTVEEIIMSMLQAAYKATGKSLKTKFSRLLESVPLDIICQHHHGKLKKGP